MRALVRSCALAFSYSLLYQVSLWNLFNNQKRNLVAANAQYKIASRSKFSATFLFPIHSIRTHFKLLFMRWDAPKQYIHKMFTFYLNLWQNHPTDPKSHEQVMYKKRSFHIFLPLKMWSYMEMCAQRSYYTVWYTNVWNFHHWRSNSQLIWV